MPKILLGSFDSLFCSKKPLCVYAVFYSSIKASEFILKNVDTKIFQNTDSVEYSKTHQYWTDTSIGF